mmetsp:Transcript_24191/g.41084  ORF Transcript_24191/g.41084 Transcript_24191/m.41084 type:complete len:218 (+) Transcript_24191:17-670(+)
MADFISASPPGSPHGMAQQGADEEELEPGASVLVLPDTWTSSRRELGDEGVWTISSAKPGNGVEQLRDHNIETYWQSDGTQPHSITIQFLRKVTLSEVCLYLDFNLDESYAPKKICVRAGSTDADLVELVALELSEPVGWTVIPLTSSEPDLHSSAAHSPPRAHLLQIQVVAMHQNGRDTHLRQVKLFGPRASPAVMGGVPLDQFRTTATQQFAMLR